MEVFMNFDRLITPTIIKIVYWLGIAAVVIAGIVAIATGEAFAGLLTIILGPIAVRVYCELLILLFRIHDSLVEVRDLLKSR
jgi:hypothetical protein